MYRMVFLERGGFGGVVVWRWRWFDRREMVFLEWMFWCQGQLGGKDVQLISGWVFPTSLMKRCTARRRSVPLRATVSVDA